MFGAKLYLYGALIGGWAMCWVGEEISKHFSFVTFGLFGAWNVVIRCCLVVPE